MHCQLWGLSIERYAPFQIMFNSFNLPQGYSRQGVETSQQLSGEMGGPWAKFQALLRRIRIHYRLLSVDSWENKHLNSRSRLQHKIETVKEVQMTLGSLKPGCLYGKKEYQKKLLNFTDTRKTHLFAMKCDKSIDRFNDVFVCSVSHSDCDWDQNPVRDPAASFCLEITEHGLHSHSVRSYKKTSCCNSPHFVFVSF